MPKKINSARRKFKSANGRDWEAEFCMHSGTDKQAPHLMVIFRDPVRVQPERYNLLPAGAPKLPKEAKREVSDDTLRTLLQRSVPVERQ